MPRTRWTLQVSGIPKPRRFDGRILAILQDLYYIPADVMFGWTLYQYNSKTARERMARITLHEANPNSVLTLWQAIRAAGIGVDCGRVYFPDGTDYCAKRYFASCGLYDGPVPQAQDGLEV